MNRRQVLAFGLTLSSSAIASFGASGQSKYPEQPVRLIVPRAVGGVVDVVARLWAEQVKSQFGSVLVENQGGGGGTIAAAAVARARPDGYTLLVGTTSELIISPLMMSNLSYDPINDLLPIAVTAVSVSSLMVHASLPVHNLTELISYAKQHPGTLSYGSAGTGTSAHLCAELFKQLAGLPDIVHVPYKGANPGLADFYSGHLPMFAASISPQVLEMHRAGKIRILVAGTNRPLRGAPDIPISVQAGFPELITLQFMGLFAPAGTQRAVIDTIAASTRLAAADAEFQKKLVSAGFEPVTESGPEQTAAFIREELARWTPLLKASAIKLQ